MHSESNALDLALDFVMRWEGGFVDDPKDPGGATKYGISLRFLRSLSPDLGDVDQDGDIDAEDVYALTRDHAESLYFSEFWQKLRLSSLPPRIAICTMDAAVNLGKRRAVLILQNALIACGYPVVADGVLGPETIGACLEADQSVLLREMLLSRIWHYAGIVRETPKFRRFLAGWLNRVAALDALLTDTSTITHTSA